MSKPNRGRRTPRPTRRTFDVKGQLLGKLGPGPFGQLVQQLREVTKEGSK